MYSTRLFQLLFVALAFACLSQAAKYDSDGLMVARQDEGDDSLLPTILPGDDGDEEDPAETSSVPEATDTGDVPTSSPTEEPEPTTTAPEEPTSTTSEEEETTTEEPTEPSTTQPEPTSTTSEEDSPSSTTDAPEPTSTNDDNDDEPTTTEEPVVTTSVETVTRTNSDGSEETMTTSHVSTSTPEPHEDGGNDGGGGGLDKNTRNIVIGVVVGVGGAILLGALGVVAWRIRSRKRAAEENDTLMDYNAGYTPVDKSEPPSSAAGTNPSSGATRSPFQSTLDTYHQPTQVNASSNF